MQQTYRPKPSDRLDFPTPSEQPDYDTPDNQYVEIDPLNFEVSVAHRGLDLAGVKDAVEKDKRSGPFENMDDLNKWRLPKLLTLVSCHLYVV